MKGLAKFRRQLRRISKDLRLRVDSRLGLYVIEQREFGRGWRNLMALADHGGVFRYPRPSDLLHLKSIDSLNYTYMGKIVKNDQEKFLSALGEEKQLQEKAFRKDVREYVDQELRPRFASAYKKLWPKLGTTYRLSEVKKQINREYE